VPIARGPAFYADKRPRTTLYVGGSGGGIFGGKRGLSGSLELSYLWGFSLDKDSVLLAGVSSAGSWRTEARDPD
jgi:hypothetical protein